MSLADRKYVVFHYERVEESTDTGKQLFTPRPSPLAPAHVVLFSNCHHFVFTIEISFEEKEGLVIIFC